MTRFDYIIVGGGLQGGLLVLALRARRPEARVCLIERAPRLGGNHTWCVFASDLSDSAREWVAPLIEHRWPGYQVHFPTDSHRVDGDYLCSTGERLHTVVTAAMGRPGSHLRLGASVAELTESAVTLTTGETVEGRAVVDARGMAGETASGNAGYQKFVGLEVALSEEHGLDRPILMDARVEQSSGYRFVYVLPLGPHRLLIEDTYFNESPRLDTDEVRSRVRAYAAEHGWEVTEVLREESGVLPMPWATALRVEARLPLRAGYRGGWFHPGTGYSFPVAARLAEAVASVPADRLPGPELRALAAAHRRQARFAMTLNRLLFRWYPPDARRTIFERFYRLPEETIRRFYRLELTGLDRARLLLGRPPRGLSPAHRFRGPGAGPD